MKTNYLIVVFIACTFLTTATVAQGKIAAPQQFNYNADLKQENNGTAKIAGIDSLLQSFVDQKKVSNVVGFVAKEGNVVYNNHR